MSKKLWSISTTVRNPYRIPLFLTIIKELEGEEWNNETQKKFQIKLIQNRLYGYSDEMGFNKLFLDGLTEEQEKNFTDFEHRLTYEESEKIFNHKNYQDPAMRGRTSFKPLEKLGLAIIEKKRIKITKLEEYVLSEGFEIGEFFFRSFLKWQYPNHLSTRDFTDKNIYNIKPFVGVLHLINEVNKLCKNKNIKAKGISKQEFEIFGLSLINYKHIKKFAKELIDFRLKLEKIKDFQKKKDFVKQYKETFLSEYTNIGNAKDYSDNAIRYFRLTRYIYIRGGGYYIDIEPRRIIEIQKLLSTDNASAKDYTKQEYIDFITDIKQPVLPWETQEELTLIYRKIISEINDYEKLLNIELTKFETPEYKELLRKIKFARNYRKKLQDNAAKYQFRKISEINRVIDNLINIRKLPIKPSIALEKFTTDALNIINDALKIKPNYPVGDDNEPTFTAPSKVPDIECFYRTFNSICEVTMLTSRNQWYNEGQPVMRHLREFEEKNEKENYCIFIAPKFHTDTINTFWMSVKYEYQGKPQKIIPFTITQLIDILNTIVDLKKSNRTLMHSQFKELLDAVIDLKNKKDNSVDWINSIQGEIKSWKNKLVA